jgi:hypothetical protein
MLVKVGDVGTKGIGGEMLALVTREMTTEMRHMVGERTAWGAAVRCGERLWCHG